MRYSHNRRPTTKNYLGIPIVLLGLFYLLHLWIFRFGVTIKILFILFLLFLQWLLLRIFKNKIKLNFGFVMFFLFELGVAVFFIYKLFE